MHCTPAHLFLWHLRVSTILKLLIQLAFSTASQDGSCGLDSGRWDLLLRLGLSYLEENGVKSVNVE